MVSLQEGDDKIRLKLSSKTDERGFERLQGTSDQHDEATFGTEKLLHSNNLTSTEQRFNGLVNSMFENLNVSFNSLENCNSGSQPENIPPQPKPKVADCVDVLEMVRRKAEINSAIISLKTNLVLGVSIIVIFTCFFLISRTLNTIMTTLLKGIIPIATAISNFVKMQDILKLYWNKYNPFSFLK